jgi:hypothetical protein
MKFGGNIMSYHGHFEKNTPKPKKRWLKVILIVLLVIVIMKKRSTMDNTPLVQYDIEDDNAF